VQWQNKIFAHYKFTQYEIMLSCAFSALTLLVV